MAAHPVAPASEPPYPRTAYAWYVLFMLTVVYVFSFIDRQILNLLVAPVRRDLAISDTQMSLLMGFTFAIFYTFFGVPLGRLADTRSRRGLIGAGFVVWSLFSAGCGLARNFTQMALMRIGVGVGEAALSPAAYSLLADYFPPARRSTALSVYGMGIYIGSGLAYLLGGFLTGWLARQPTYLLPLAGEVRSWQVVFFAVGLPGVALAALMLTVAEPFRRGLAVTRGAVRSGDLFRYIRDHRATYACHHLGVAFVSFAAYATHSWMPSFFARTHGWSVADFGKIFGLIIIVCGSGGVVWGGWLADRLRARGVRDANLRVALIAAFSWFPFGVTALLAPDSRIAVTLLAPAVFFSSATFGIGPAALVEMTPPAMRSQAGAVYLFVVNLIGLGLGPTAVALLTDYVFASDLQVGASLLVVTGSGHVLACALFWVGRAPFLRSLRALA